MKIIYSDTMKMDFSVGDVITQDNFSDGSFLFCKWKNHSVDIGFFTNIAIFTIKKLKK